MKTLDKILNKKYTFLTTNLYPFIKQDAYLDENMINVDLFRLNRHLKPQIEPLDLMRDYITYLSISSPQEEG